MISCSEKCADSQLIGYIYKDLWVFSCCIMSVFQYSVIDEINLCSVSYVQFEYEADLCGLLEKLCPVKQLMACMDILG